ncbi:NACHT domain-containing protein [Candidatus Leptofilum sp.]|uniref:NACHT domain-containing protein n=1 Tax=Candidatus Leptofilum sp. TaxID=3241576 RepID=UPI003B5C1027
MPIDPFTATAIGATAKWMWDSYGKTFVDGWVKNVGGSREKKQLEKQWREASQTYLEKLYDQVNWLRLLGKKEGMPLERIYTDLNVLDQPTAEKWYDRATLEEDYKGRRSFHVRRATERQDGLKVATEFNRLYILGKPGAGKTTFMKFMTLETLRGKLGEKIPIFITLKELSDKGQAIFPFIVEQLQQCGFEDAERFVKELLKEGRAVVLLDGLDEVNLADEKRTKLIAAMKDFVVEFEKCQVLITCRIAASDYSFARFKYVEMADFTEEQQKRFIFKWFQDDMARRDVCWQALKDNKSANLRELAHVPLLLTLLCITFERRGEFPPDRDEVYRTAVNALLYEWDNSRLIKRDKVYEGLDVKYRERLLAWIAFETFSRNEYLLDETKLAALIEAYLSTVPRMKADVDGFSVLKTIEAQHGLLVERAQGIYSFSHLTLQEYFTARFVVDNAQDALPQLVAHVGEDLWREVFLLTAGMLYGADNFAQQYVASLTNLIINEQTLVSYLKWAAEKSAGVATKCMPAAARSWFFFLDRAFALDFARTLDLDRTLDRTLTRESAFALDLARAHALDLAHTLDRTLVSLFDRDRTLDLDFNRTLAFNLKLALALALALDLAISYDYGLVTQLSLDRAKIVQHLQVWSRQQSNLPNWLPHALANLGVPLNHKQLAKLLLRYWRLEQFWEFDRSQLDLLIQYLAGTQVLVDCLQVATVQDRAAIEAQLLLPPN